jgi:hypothetical protein
MKFSKRILPVGITVGLIGLIILTFLTISSSQLKIIYKSVLFGDVITFLNFTLGLLFIFFGINRPVKTFLISIFGGLVFRLAIMLVLVVVSLKFLEINEISFIFSLLFFYIFYAIIEIIYLNFSKK